MKKAGILGGGQLGRMLLQAAANYPVETFVLENDDQCPSANLCDHFIKGDIRSFDDVYAFGKMVDVLTIEIENVNLDALEKLETEGLTVIPKPGVLRTIQDKILQKEFYKTHQIPTAEFVITENKAQTEKYTDFLPAVHKIGKGGYDGKGVQVLDSHADLDKAFDAPAVLEKKIDVEREISAIIAVDQNLEMAIYPLTDMVFDKKLNLLSYQISPADLSENVFYKVDAIAHKVVSSFKSPGLFAVELLLDGKGNVLVNETAPRVHNSGHHTIEGNYSSQFDQVWRILLGYPLGNSDKIKGAALINLVGEGNAGAAKYDGLDEVLKLNNAFIHIYGKKESKAGRKMGHVTLLSDDVQDLIYKVNIVKSRLKVTGAE